MTTFHVDNDHKFIFQDGGITHPVYRDGTGPGVLILHELPGMSPKCIELAQLVMEQGYASEWAKQFAKESIPLSQ